MATLHVNGVYVGETVGAIEVIEPGNCHNGRSVSDDLAETIEDTVKYPEQCPETAATLLIMGRTRYGSCPPILSHRSKLCECGRVHPNGLRKPWKTCCGKG